jgi:RNA polymerase sigma-70 factor (ECF subfamily)
MAIPKSKGARDLQFSSVVNNDVKSPGQQNTCVKQLSYCTQQDIKDLFEKHYTKLCGNATAIVDDLQLAKDIVAEVFAKLLQEEVDRLPVHKLETLLFTLIDQKCREHIKLQQFTANSAPAPEVFTPSNATAIEEEISSLIYDELSKLPPQRRQIMIQLYMKGLTSKQVAKRMKLSRQTVLNQKVRALKVLRNNILSRLF